MKTMEIPFNRFLGQKTARNHDTTCRKSSHNKEMGNDWAEYFLNVVVSMNLIENSSFTVLCHVMEENVDERYLKREISFIAVEHKNTSRYPKRTKKFGHWLYSPFRIY